MRNLLIIWVSIFLILGLFARTANAEGPLPRPMLETAPGYTLSRQIQQKLCRKDPSITFTGEQAKEMERLQHAFLEEVRPLRDEMRELRLELRFAESGPQRQHEDLLEKHRRMVEIQARVENLRVSYLMKARSIFTKEELQRLPKGCPLKTGSRSDQKNRSGIRFFQEWAR